MSSDGEHCSLKISPVEIQDQGIYKCVISNKAGTQSCEAKLAVEELVDFKESTDGTAPGFPVTKRPSRSKSGAKPTILSPLEDIEVNDGENVTLEVTSGPEPIDNIEWFKDNDLIRSQPRFTQSSAGEQHTLDIQSVTVDDEGIYKCVLLNNWGIASCSAEVLVEESMSESSSQDDEQLVKLNARMERRRSRDSVCEPEFQQELSNNDVFVGDTVYFTVKSRGIPEPEVSWYRNGDLVKEDSRVDRKSVV